MSRGAGVPVYVVPSAGRSRAAFEADPTGIAKPIDAAMASIASWQSRPALLHLSSPYTSRSNRLTSGHGAHSDYLDVASGIWLLRSIKQAGMCADCELEVGAGPVALTQFQKAIIQHAPDLVPWIHGLTG